jgi:hypothetical protein
MFILGLSKMPIKKGKKMNFEGLELINMSHNILSLDNEKGEKLYHFKKICV